MHVRAVNAVVTRRLYVLRCVGSDSGVQTQTRTWWDRPTCAARVAKAAQQRLHEPPESLRCAALWLGDGAREWSALKPSQARRTVRCRAVRRRSCGTCAPFAFEALSKLVGLLYLPFDSVSRLEASAQVYLRRTRPSLVRRQFRGARGTAHGQWTCGFHVAVTFASRVQRLFAARIGAARRGRRVRGGGSFRFPFGNRGAPATPSVFHSAIRALTLLTDNVARSAGTGH